MSLGKFQEPNSVEKNFRFGAVSACACPVPSSVPSLLSSFAWPTRTQLQIYRFSHRSVVAPKKARADGKEGGDSDDDRPSPSTLLCPSPSSSLPRLNDWRRLSPSLPPLNDRFWRRPLSPFLPRLERLPLAAALGCLSDLTPSPTPNPTTYARNDGRS